MLQYCDSHVQLWKDTFLIEASTHILATAKIKPMGWALILPAISTY